MHSTQSKANNTDNTLTWTCLHHIPIAGTTKTSIFDNGVFSDGPALMYAARFPSGVELNEDEVLVFNGNDNGALNKAAIYSFQAGSWTNAGPTPAASSSRHSAVVTHESSGEDIVIITGKFPFLFLWKALTTFVSGRCQDGTNSSRTITEVKHLEFNQFPDG